MILVQRANVQLGIDEAELQKYESMGYVKVEFKPVEVKAEVELEPEKEIEPIETAEEEKPVEEPVEEVQLMTSQVVEEIEPEAEEPVKAKSSKK